MQYWSHTPHYLRLVDNIIIGILLRQTLETEQEMHTCEAASAQIAACNRKILSYLVGHSCLPIHLLSFKMIKILNVKVHIFGEGHIILRNLHLTFD